MRSRMLALAAALTHASAVAGCGGDVVVTPRGESAGAGGGSAGGPPSSSSTTTGQGGAGTTTGSFAQSSSSSGQPNPCAGAPCGVPCTVCNEVECFMGFCDGNGVCDMPAMECKMVGPMQPCPTAESAPALLCGDCGGGKGCTFLGCIIGGPSGGDGTCCYDLIGGCVANP